MRDFGMKLQSHHALCVSDGGDGVAVSASQHFETIWKHVYAIAVAHPYRHAQRGDGAWLIQRVSLRGGGVDALKDTEVALITGGTGQCFEDCRAILAPSTGGGDVSAKLMSQQLHAVTDAQHG